MPSGDFREFDVWDEHDEFDMFEPGVASRIFAEEQADDELAESFSFSLPTSPSSDEPACPICADHCPASDASCSRGKDYFSGFADARKEFTSRAGS